MLCSFNATPTCDISVTYVFTPNCPDLSVDGLVDASDLAKLLAEWDSASGDAVLDGSGLVDASDLALLLGSWGACDRGRA